MRVVEIDGQPWFVAADVCRCLGIHLRADGQAHVTAACRKLDHDEKGCHPIATLRGTQKVAVVSESGLYKLIMRSDKPEG